MRLFRIVDDRFSLKVKRQIAESFFTAPECELDDDVCMKLRREFQCPATMLADEDFMLALRTLRDNVPLSNMRLARREGMFHMLPPFKSARPGSRTSWPRSSNPASAVTVAIVSPRLSVSVPQPFSDSGCRTIVRPRPVGRTLAG